MDEFDVVYRWHLGDASATDGYRVLGHTGGSAGRWILVGDRITLSPLGGVLDDWARVMAALAAMATYGRVELNAGSWNVKTNQVTPSYAHLWVWPGVHLASTLNPSTPFESTPFYNGGGTTTTTTFSVTAPAGAKTITVADASAIAIGATVLLKSGTSWANQRDVVDKSGSVLTLDSPLDRPFAIGDAVNVTLTARGIRIEGNGATITGTGASPCLLVTARDCIVRGLNASVTMTFGFIYDVGSRDCLFEDISIDCLGVTTSSGFLFSRSENCHTVRCRSYRPTTANVYFSSCDSCFDVDGAHEGSGGNGMFLSSDDTGSDTMGCRNCGATRSTFSGAVGAALALGTFARGNRFTDVLLEASGTGWLNASGCNDNSCSGTIRRNTTTAIQDTGVGNRFSGSIRDHDSGLDANLIVINTGADFTLSDVTITDPAAFSGLGALTINVVASAGTFTRTTGSFLTNGFRAGQTITTSGFTNGGNNATKVIASVTATVITVTSITGLVDESGNDNERIVVTAGNLCSVAGTGILRMRNVYASTGRNGENIVYIATGGTLLIDGARFIATQNHYGIRNDGGLVRYRGLVMVAATGGTGILLNGATSYARDDGGNDLSGCLTPVNVSTGKWNRGTFTLNGATPVAVAFPPTTAQDRIFLSPKTTGGTPTGIVFTGAPTPGTGFSVVGIAGDTSIYEYEIR